MSKRTHAGTVPATFVPSVEVTEEQRRIGAMAVAVLLAYPGEDFSARLQSVSEAVTDVPAAIRENIEAFVASMAAWSNRDVQSHYVETFDQRRRCSLFLSYYSVGDTRQRGAAILTFRHQLQELGLQEISDELPDHLCVLLEALGNSEGERHERAVEMLAAHRDGIEVLRAALDNLSSPYAYLITAVCQFLPEIDEETAARYIDLIISGPPAEMVGIIQLPSRRPNRITPRPLSLLHVFKEK